MRIGMVGLGRMGSNMTKRILEHGHEVVCYDRNPEAVADCEKEGAIAATDLSHLVTQLDEPRAVWLMLPHGPATESTVEALSGMLRAGDVMIDGSNSPFRAARRISDHLRERGIHFIDCGVSGGVWGLRNGYCLMVGGDRDAVETVEPIFTTLAPEDGYAHVGPSGAGHFVKMIHNGIEYGLLQAYAEGFALLESAEELDLDLRQIAALWNHGSVVRSWILELTELALENPQEFDSIRGYVEDSGEGRWTVQEAVERAVPAPVITASLFARFSSRDDERFAARIVAALRNQFGGHKFFTEAEAAERIERDAEAAGVPPSPESSVVDGEEDR